VKGSVPLGDITADFNRAVVAAGTENRGGESTLGNFVADVQLWAAEQWASEDATRRVPVLAFMNPGGLRADLKYLFDATHPGDADGRVTYQEAAGVQPFANTLVVEDVTGEQIRQALEQQWQPAGASRPFLKLGIAGGLEYTFDPAAPAGARVSNITIEGVPLDLAAVYPIVANAFLTAGGDNFGGLNGANKQDTGRVDLESMVDYLAANPLVSPDLAQRSIGVQLSAADADGYSTGDQVTLTLSSLLMSSGGPAGATVEVSAGGVLLASSPIDPTLTPATPLDESGKATVVVTLPASAAGSLVLTVAVPAAGTSIDVPLTVTQQPITNVTPPTITGDAEVGATLTATDGTWSVLGAAFAYQWNRDGVAITGATGATYDVTPTDAGADVTVTVTASKDGYGDGTATSMATSIAKADSETSARLNKHITKSNGKVTVKVEVDGQYGILPFGEVIVYDGQTEIATGTVGENGKVTIKLPKLSPGVHVISVRFGGNDQLEISTSFPSVLIVY
jgi:5'-nucleotidase